MIRNLTARVIRLYQPDRPNGLDDLDLGLKRTLDPAPQPARIAPLPLVTAHQDDVPVELIEYRHVANLPAPLDGVWYVVPFEVALVLSARRTDILVTHDDVLSADGSVIGHRALAQPA
ncbi:hypothetical protein GPZ77_34700 (plasmid) [Streptomyces sp. QHH-9511]|uniref:hypothetical protein n=1 Tax=Streptomyces sp. QHH-9511 TaxID=2684468 RepID=UPI001315EC75|nr:hypothetical protein [Streptomyces sp. QHH-9511]QGZ53378.1 hypothetical protein GPZ77_34700 [Streptomyces sp. QHH-9511]